MNATGSVDARDWVMVKAQATGLQVQQILVTEGQTVQAGQTIALLDNSILQSQLNQAKAQLTSSQAQLTSARAQRASVQAAVLQKKAVLKQQQATLAEAESNLRRYQELTQQGAETRQNLEARTTTVATARESVNVAQANIASAQADVSRAEAEVSRAEAEVQNNQAQMQKLETQLGQAIVKASVSGVLAKPSKDSSGKPVKDVRVGDLTGTDPLFYIMNNGGLELRLQVPENSLSQIQVGAVVQISSDADKRINGQGQVREIDPVVNEQTRQAIVKVDLPSSPYLKPGMFLKAAIVTQTNPALTVPSQAVLPQSDGGAIVYLLEGKDTVRQRPVTIGTRQNATDPAQARTEIKTGLKPGDRVVVAGAGFLKDGDRVTVAKQF
jgi:RND family efflux transporter MFP subunit